MLHRHYKGGLYRGLADDAKHSETQEDMIVYMSVETGKGWVRPAVMFIEYVPTGEGYVGRFEPVDD